MPVGTRYSPPAHGLALMDVSRRKAAALDKKYFDAEQHYGDSDDGYAE